MRILIVTGLSGAGKTEVIKALEDIGYYCVDNMPPELIPKFAEICGRAPDTMNNIVVVTDIRGGDMFGKLSTAIDELQELGYESEILFLEASDDVLIKRYKQSRRLHPGADGGTILDGISRDRILLSDAKARADFIIDTSNLSSDRLRNQIKSMFKTSGYNDILINVMSFGFKYGIPLDADLVFDVRFLPNPFYISKFKEKTGLQTCVHDYVMGFEESKKFLNMLTDMIGFLIPQYVKEGKNQLVISIGCTGGHHRSVTLAEELYKFLEEKKQNVTITHRDINKGV